MITVKLVLGSGGHSPPERIAVLRRTVRRTFGERVQNVLYLPYAQIDPDVGADDWVDNHFDADYEIYPLHWSKEPRRAIEKAEAFFVDGGQTFLLLKTLYDLDLLSILRERVLAGVPYMGVSAGTNIACPTIATTNDMPIVWPQSSKALDLVPFQINTHYIDPHRKVVHRGETRDERISEYHCFHERPVIGLREGAILIVDGEPKNLRVRLHGTAGARLFRRGQQPLDVAPGRNLTSLLIP